MNHIHRYIRKKLGSSFIYKCNLKGCTHFIQKELVEGRNCICNRCGNPFIIIKETLKNCPAKPHCNNCYKKPSREKILDELIDTLVGE